MRHFKILHVGFEVKHPNHKPITVTFKLNGPGKGCDVTTSQPDERRGFEFFMNSDKPTDDDAIDYAQMFLAFQRKI